MIQHILTSEDSGLELYYTRYYLIGYFRTRGNCDWAFDVWITCIMFFFFFIISCYHDDWCNEVNDVYSELSSVATNCHRKSETSDPGPISLISACVLRPESWGDQHGCRCWVEKWLVNSRISRLYYSYITHGHIHTTQESIVSCGEFLLCLLQLFSFVRTSRDKCEVVISSRLRLITAKGFLRLSSRPHPVAIK